MAAPRHTDAEFMAAWNRHNGHGPSIAKELGLSDVRSMMKRRRRLEASHQVQLPANAGLGNGYRAKEYVEKIGHRIRLTVRDGTVVIFGDCHYWPGDMPIAHVALVKFIRKYQPVAIICNGDVFDGARVSRHPPTGWAQMPEVKDEIEYCQRMIAEIVEAAPRKAKLCWNAGNHDTRFSARLAQMAPEYVGIKGTDLPDHFPDFEFAWSTEINDDVMVKHRFRAGTHAAWNNVLHGGVTMFTNHVHRLCVTPITDYKGRRWGVDCGCIADFGPTEHKFTYGEDNPYNWGSGFAVATFKHGKLLPPELVQVQDKIAYFRGEPV